MPIARALSFHWFDDALPASQSADHFLTLCSDCEHLGFDSVYVPVVDDLSRALQLALLAAPENPRLKFRIGGNFEHILSSLTGRDLVDASQVLGSRLVVHMSFCEGAPEPDLNERRKFAAAAEFLVNCCNLFPAQQAPQFDIQGESSQAAILAIKHADCLWRRAQIPRQVHADALPVLHFGKQTGLVFDIITRTSQQDALDSLQHLMPDLDVTSLPATAAGIITHHPNRPPVLVGSFSHVARMLSEFNAAGISHCMIGSLGRWDEAAIFAEHVLPLIRSTTPQRQVA